MSQSSRPKLLEGLPPEWRGRLVEEERQARQAAAVFARVCRDGDAGQLYDAHLLLNECNSDAWRFAMAEVAKLPHVSPEVQAAFVPIWVESKMLPLRVGHRATMAAALRVLMPGGCSGPMILYRGANSREQRCRTYGFSWTTTIATARSFAEHWSHPMPASSATFQGVVLQTLAPAEAVLLTRQPGEYYDEGEVVVDPYRLGTVAVVERLEAK